MRVEWAIHINQLVRYSDQRHLVVVVDYLVIVYQLIASYFNF